MLLYENIIKINVDELNKFIINIISIILNFQYFESIEKKTQNLKI